MRRTKRSDHLKSGKATHAVIDMHHQITGGQACGL